MRTPLITFIIVAFILTSSVNPAVGAIRESPLFLPTPGTMVHLSPAFNPPVLKGIKVHPDNSFRFDFILDQGSLPLVGRAREGELKQESTKLIKYFLASLTIPEKDLWVNLSPYEKDRIVPEAFGQTEMGRDLLAQDYLLKQITASLIYPEDEIGKKFWKRIYEEATKKFGTTNIPVNTFNKVWIVPEKAVVYENAQAGTAYVVESKLKVMLEQDYLSLDKNSPPHKEEGINAVGSQIIHEVVIPELTKEINQGKNFAQLRQVYNSLILATWYKKKIKDSILNHVYSDRNKIDGISNNDPKAKEEIYQQYLRAFKKGVFNYISAGGGSAFGGKEEPDPITQKSIPKKYFSGGIAWDATHLSPAMTIADERLVPKHIDHAMRITADLSAVGVGNFAMVQPTKPDKEKGFVQAPYRESVESRLFMRLLVGIVITAGIGWRLSVIDPNRPVERPVESSLTSSPETVPENNMDRWHNGEPQLIHDPVDSGKIEISPEAMVMWKGLEPEKRKAFRKIILSAYFKQVFERLALGEWEKDATGRNIVELLKNKDYNQDYDPDFHRDFVDIIAGQEWVRERTPFSALKFTDFLTEARFKDPDQKADYQAGFQAVYGMFNEEGFMGDSIDAKDFAHFIGLSGDLLAVAQKEGLPISEATLREKLANTQQVLGQLTGNLNLDPMLGLSYLRDYLSNPDQLRENLRTLSRYLGDDVTAKVLQDHTMFGNLVDKLDASRVNDLIRGDPREFVDTVQGLKSKFDWETVSGILENPSDFNLVRDLRQDMGDQFGGLIDDIRDRYPSADPKDVLIEIEQARLKGTSSEAIWGELDQKLRSNPAMVQQRMVGINKNKQAPGGIDLTAGKMDVKGNDDRQIRWNIDPAMLQKLNNARGFVSLIINIESMTNLRMFLGLSNLLP